MGPEGWLREEQARSAHIDSQDDLSLLLRYGADCIGAVGIQPEKAEDSIPESAEAGPTPGRTVSGIQKKLLVVRDVDSYTRAGRDGPAPYIAKFNSDAIESLVRNEFLSLRWVAAVLGKKEVTDFALGQVDGVHALVVTRFDRGSKGEKLRLEDCAQILVKPRGADYGGKYDSTYEEIAEIIKAHSALPQVDLARFYRRLITFALIGNCDAHLKNFSMLEAPRGLRLSPAYDVLNTAFYKNFSREFGLELLGKRRQIETLDGELFRQFGVAIGLNPRTIDTVFEDLKRGVRKAAVLIQPPEAEGQDGFVNRFADIVRNQCLRILGE